MEDGWLLLFDGETITSWRGYQSTELPKGWKAEDGTLARTSSGGDIVTVEQYGSFILQLEYMISPRGNSGVFFHVTEDHEEMWETGPELQILDNAAFGDDLDPRVAAGANYALHGPIKDYSNGADEWNHVRLEVRGALVTHFLNGRKLLEYELWTDEWRDLVSSTKFGAMPEYGHRRIGHIALQDHGNVVRFRNIKILPLD